MITYIHVEPKHSSTDRIVAKIPTHSTEEKQKKVKKKKQKTRQQSTETDKEGAKHTARFSSPSTSSFSYSLASSLLLTMSCCRCLWILSIREMCYGEANELKWNSDENHAYYLHTHIAVIFSRFYFWLYWYFNMCSKYLSWRNISSFHSLDLCHTHTVTRGRSSFAIYLSLSLSFFSLFILRVSIAICSCHLVVVSRVAQQPYLSEYVVSNLFHFPFCYFGFVCYDDRSSNFVI